MASGAKGVISTKNLDLLRKAIDNKLSPDELEEFRTYLSSDPQTWQVIGDLQWQLRNLIAEAVKENVQVFESVKFKLKELGKSLETPDDSAAERLLIDQVVTCWLDASIAGNKYATALAGPHPTEVQLFHERIYNMAQSRLVRSIEALARVRKLGLPNVQINVAEKQINVAQG